MAVVPDDDVEGLSEEDAQQPPRSLTPQTPPVNAQPSPSPPRPIRQRALYDYIYYTRYTNYNTYLFKIMKF